MRAARYHRPSLAIVVVAVSILCVASARTAVAGGMSDPLRPGSAGLARDVQAGGHAGEAFPPDHPEAVSRQSVHGEPLWVTIARLVNFAILIGVLVYFLRAPIASYLARRSTEIRSDLAKAAETSQAASSEMERIEQRMKSLPAELDALKLRGAEEVAAEEARIHQAADADRERLLEQARREIDLQLRSAQRDLRKQAADLAVDLAADRIEQNITDADQAQLVDRYLAQMEK